MILSPVSAPDGLQMTAREVKDTGSDRLSAAHSGYGAFGWGTFSPLFISQHFAIPFPPLFCLLSFPFPLPAGDWKVEERAAPWSRPRELKEGIQAGELRRGLRCDNHDAEQTASVNPAGAGAGLCTPLLLASRQIGNKGTWQGNASYQETLLLSSSLHITPSASYPAADWNRAHHSHFFNSPLYFGKFFICHYKVLAFLRCVVMRESCCHPATTRAGQWHAMHSGISPITVFFSYQNMSPTHCSL